MRGNYVCPLYSLVFVGPSCFKPKRHHKKPSTPNGGRASLPPFHRRKQAVRCFFGTSLIKHFTMGSFDTTRLKPPSADVPSSSSRRVPVRPHHTRHTMHTEIGDLRPSVARKNSRQSDLMAYQFKITRDSFRDPSRERQSLDEWGSTHKLERSHKTEKWSSKVLAESKARGTFDQSASSKWLSDNSDTVDSHELSQGFEPHISSRRGSLQPTSSTKSTDSGKRCRRLSMQPIRSITRSYSDQKQRRPSLEPTSTVNNEAAFELMRAKEQKDLSKSLHSFSSNVKRRSMEPTSRLLRMSMKTKGNGANALSQSLHTDNGPRRRPSMEPISSSAFRVQMKRRPSMDAVFYSASAEPAKRRPSIEPVFSSTFLDNKQDKPQRRSSLAVVPMRTNQRKTASEKSSKPSRSPSLDHTFSSTVLKSGTDKQRRRVSTTGAIGTYNRMESRPDRRANREGVSSKSSRNRQGSTLERRPRSRTRASQRTEQKRENDMDESTRRGRLGITSSASKLKSRSRSVGRAEQRSTSPSDALWNSSTIETVSANCFDGISVAHCRLQIHRGEGWAHHKLSTGGRKTASSTYVEVWRDYPKEMAGKTDNIRTTLNPTFHETFQIMWRRDELLSVAKNRQRAKLTLKIYDRDEKCAREARGTVEITLPLPGEEPTVSEKWYPVTNAKGQMLVSFKVRYRMDNDKGQRGH